MTEYADKSTEEMASAFIVGTCQLLPKPISVISDHMHNLIEWYNSAEGHSNTYVILCGSFAEFYIRPPNVCIDDNDSLIATADELAFSGDFAVLPNDMSDLDLSGLDDSIKCCKIETYDRHPGFVRLRVCEKMNYNWKYKKYELEHTGLTNGYMSLNMDIVANTYSPISSVKLGKSIVSGPAITHQRDKPDDHNSETDLVRSVWCPQWPKEAHAWLYRPRNNGWPTIRTISEVVHSGCHVVYVQHRSCRDDKLQWRLSFSFAEVILLQSWTLIQQIVYHLLRYFAKRELIQKDCPKEDEILCMYHLKTLMLWTCEEMSSEWWNSFSVITICCKLLQKLSEWLKKRHCPNYFIPEANLFHQPSDPTILNTTEKRLNKFQNSGTLCNWFVENYIQTFIRRNFKYDSSAKSLPHFVDCILPLLEFWKVYESKALNLIFLSTFAASHDGCRRIMRNGISSGLRQSFKVGYNKRWIEPKKINDIRADLPTIQNVFSFTYYDILLYILHTAYGLDCGEISWDGSLFVEFVQGISTQPRIIRSKYHNFPKTYTTQSSRFQFLRAQDLMQHLTGSNSRPEFQLLSLMSKEFLRRVLEYEDSKCNGIATAAMSYLAAVHFATSEYQQAMRLSFAVVDQTYKEDKETLNAGCLLFIDDIAKIVGLYVLEKNIRNDNLHYIGKRQYLDLRLSPEVFAYYLTALSGDRMSKRLDLHHDFPDSAFPMDEYLMALFKPKYIVSMMSGSHSNVTKQISYCTTDSFTETESKSSNPLIAKEAIIHVLMEYALENMTSFYDVIRKDFGIHCNTVDCYRALYLYKCRKYNEVQHLCERILHEPDLQSDLKKLFFVNVLLLPPLDSFFDSDLQSLIGFHTLLHYFSLANDVLRKNGLIITSDSTFEQWNTHRMALKMDVPFGHSWFRKYRYSTNCRYSVGRHFLARYLKVRCCIDCNLSYKEAMTEFSARKSNSLFEHIIRRYFLRKFHILNK